MLRVWDAKSRLSRFPSRLPISRLTHVSPTKGKSGRCSASALASAAAPAVGSPDWEVEEDVSPSITHHANYQPGSRRMRVVY